MVTTKFTIALKVSMTRIDFAHSMFCWPHVMIKYDWLNHMSYHNTSRISVFVWNHDIFSACIFLSYWLFCNKRIFQDGRHGVSQNLFFGLEMTVNGQKRLFDTIMHVLSMENVYIMSWILFKCSDFFNMSTNFQDGRHRLSRNNSFVLDGSRRPKRWFGK